MKLVPLLDLPGLKTADIIRTVIERPSQGAGIAELRARCKVLDALDAAGTGAAVLHLEDEPHTTLVKALNSFQFGIASKDLLAIVDGILEAKEP